MIIRQLTSNNLSLRKRLQDDTRFFQDKSAECDTQIKQLRLDNRSLKMKILLLKLESQKMKKQNVTLKQLRMDIEYLKTLKNIILKDKTNLSNIVRNSTSMKTNTSQVKELPPVSDQPKPGDQPPAATH